MIAAQNSAAAASHDEPHEEVSQDGRVGKIIKQSQHQSASNQQPVVFAKKTQKPKKTSATNTSQIKKTIILPAESEIKLPRVTVSIGPKDEQKRTIRVVPQTLNVKLRTVVQGEGT